MRIAEIAAKTKKAEREEEDKTQREADQKRLQLEAALDKEKEEHRFAVKMAINKLRESEIGRKLIDVIGEEELYKYDPNSINSLHIDAVIKHTREQKEKLKVQYKKVDFLIRAMHEAEVPLIQENAEKEMRMKRETQLLERQNAIERRERLIRMEKEKYNFLQSIRGQRHEDYVKDVEEFEKRLRIAREQRLVQLRQENVEKKKQDFRNEKLLKKQRIKLAEERRIQAEKKRQEDERIVLLDQAYAERQKKLDEQARKQREREAEIERRLQAEKESTQTTAAPVTTVRRVAGTGHQQDKDKTDK